MNRNNNTEGISCKTLDPLNEERRRGIYQKVKEWVILTKNRSISLIRLNRHLHKSGEWLMMTKK